MLSIGTFKLWFLWLRQRVFERFSTFGRTADKQPRREWQLEAINPQALLHTLGDRAKCDLVDGPVWRDLELEKLFLRLDGSITPLGTQYLYAQLRRYESEPGACADNSLLFHSFASSPKCGEGVRSALSHLNRTETGFLAGLVFGARPELPRGYRLFPLISFAAVACPFALILSSSFLWPSLALWGLSIALHWYHGSVILRNASALASLGDLLKSSQALLNTKCKSDLPEIRTLEELGPTLDRMKTKLSRVFQLVRRGDDLTLVLLEYLNVLCLFELNASCLAIAAIRKEQPALAKAALAIARLDAFQGLARSLKGNLVCQPTLTNSGSLQFVNAYHPLPVEPVKNSIFLTDRGVLFSGSNMSGKTTFMKTVGINLVLAQTVGLCFAEKAIVPACRVATLIERMDTVSEGRSHFFSEACELLTMIRDAEYSGRSACFLLDEPFRGTNTIERIASTSAILSYLSSRWITVASTHDYEVVRFLEKAFDCYHFAENPESNEAAFDYRLRPGPTTSRNAIKLLVRAGYPESVTDLAFRLIKDNMGWSGAGKPTTPDPL